MTVNNETDFVQTAREYCLWVETGSVGELDRVQSLLAKLHAAILDIPAIEPDSDGTCDVTIANSEYDKIVERLRGLPINVYWDVLEPLAEDGEQPACGSLVDDLADIYRDVKDGLLNYDQGRKKDALFDWRTSFETHWGRHLTDAQRVIYTHIFK